MNYAVRLMGIGRTHIFLYYAVKPVRGYTCDAWPLIDASRAVRMVPLQYSVKLPYSSSCLLPEVLLTIERLETNGSLVSNSILPCDYAKHIRTVLLSTSVCLSVRPSVCLSVKRLYCDKNEST